MRLHNIPVFLSVLVFAVTLLFAQGVMAVEQIELIKPGHITPEEGKELIRLKEDLVIIDVRDPHEFIMLHYPNALNIPVNELESRLTEVPEDRPVLVYCGRGIRSERAYEILLETRPDMELYHIQGVPIF